jgi:hypothetical protein
MSCCRGAKVPAADEAPAWYPAIAATSWAHISSYMPSTAMIAGVSSPKIFCLMSETKAFRLLEIDCSGTVMERAASNADATSWDCRAAVSEWVAAAVSHATYGAAACAIACDAAPCHAPFARLEVTDPNELAAWRNELPNDCQACEA